MFDFNGMFGFTEDDILDGDVGMSPDGKYIRVRILLKGPLYVGDDSADDGVPTPDPDDLERELQDIIRQMGDGND